MDMEVIIRNNMIKNPEQQIKEWRAIIENIEVIAKMYGSRTNVREIDRKLQALSALDTIANIASSALIGAE